MWLWLCDWGIWLKLKRLDYKSGWKTCNYRIRSWYLRVQILFYCWGDYVFHSEFFLVNKYEDWNRKKVSLSLLEWALLGFSIYLVCGKYDPLSFMVYVTFSPRVHPNGCNAMRAFMIRFLFKLNINGVLAQSGRAVDF